MLERRSTGVRVLRTMLKCLFCAHCVNLPSSEQLKIRNYAANLRLNSLGGKLPSDSCGIVHIKPKVRILGEIFSGSRYSFEYSKSVGDKSFEELSFLFNIPLNKNFSIDFELKKTFSEKTFYLGGSYYF